MNKTNFVQNIAFISLVIFSAIIVFTPKTGYFIFAAELLIQFQVQTSFILFLIFIILVFKRLYILSIMQILLLVFNIFPIIRSYSLWESPPNCIYDKAQKPLRIFSYNIYHKNKNFDQIIHAIKISDADLVILQEAKSHFLNYAHNIMVKEYPFYYPEIDKGKRSSWTLYSKYPVTSSVIKKSYNNKAIYASINIDGTPVNITGVHTKSPKTLYAINARNQHIKNLSDDVNKISKTSSHIIVAGDFNSVPWHPSMQKFITESNLNNNLIFNIFGTWPTWSIPFFTVPIDHIMHNDGFYKATYYRGKPSGSDHFPIYADLYFCK